ncbi:hypothetical protein I317_01171 [Kwoniella heveanensis CBS 569]|nr:hypothetical protein I317_01171 [Kwoniella heveanensis CBS 569]
MAMAYPLDTPDRVLKRVQRLEDMELPSLPSFQHDDIDYDSMSNTESNRDEYKRNHHSFEQDMTHDDMATPHPLRQATLPTSTSTMTGGTTHSADSFSTASGSPFPPLASHREGTPSPYAPATALTSTPQSKFGGSMTRSMGRSTSDYPATASSRPSRHERTQSGTASLGSSNQTASRRERWQTPGEMSGSFSGEYIPDGIEMGSEKSVPLNDRSQASYDFSHSQTLPELPEVSSILDRPEETPVTRRLSSSNHILSDRPKKRGPSVAMHQLEAVPQTPNDFSPPMTPKVTASQPAITSALHIPQGDRIPSLSRSEVSATDTSGPATTPEGPNRNVSMVTPRPDSHQEYEITGQNHLNDRSGEEEDHEENPTMEYHEEYEYTPQDNDESNGHHQTYASPAKSTATHSPSAQMYTPSAASYPGTARNRSSHHSNYDSPAHTSTVLHDITNSVQNSSPAPFTPTPAGYPNKNEEITTPRAPLNDAERRKSHILAVLGSSDGPQSRVLRPSFRGTPHPLRRVSTAPDTESIAEEGSDFGRSQRSSRMGETPRSQSHLLAAEHSVNESFVSVASSADLTSDKRASHLHSRLSRGNTSFPTMLLPTNPSSSPGGGSLKGLSDQRADGIKIHKHLNAMNKQLLETNAELAREAEAWRDEVDRLRDMLQEHGIEVEDVDVLANANVQSTSASISQQLPEWPIASPSGRNSTTKGDHSDLISQLSSVGAQKNRPPSGKTSHPAQDLLDGLSPEEHAAVMQEMAERLEMLEDGLDEKDQVIADLEQRLDEAKQAGGFPGEQDPSQEKVEEELRAQLEQAEQARIALHEEFSQKTEQHAKRFGEICSGFEAQVRGLEQELAVARADAERLRTERTRLESLSSAAGPESDRDSELRKRVLDLEVELGVARVDIRKRMTEVENLKHHSTQLLQEKEALMLRAERSEEEVADLKSRLSNAENLDSRATGATDYLDVMKVELKAACEAQADAEDQVAHLQEEVETAQKTTARQESAIEELAQVISDLEADLAAAAQDTSRAHEQVEDELRAAQQELQGANERLADKESEIEMLMGRLEVANIATQALQTSQRRSTSPTSPVTPITKTPGQAAIAHGNPDSFVAAMEERLDEAYKEIGRLKHELGATPQRKSAIQVRDARIQALEREKAALADRLASARSATTLSTPIPEGVQHAESPFKRATPFVHRAIASLKTPKTPGPIRELSWLQTTIGDVNEPVLQAQLEYLQHELEDANHQLDSNFSRLESAGLGAIALAEKLAAAEEKIGELEDEIRTLIQRNKASLALVSAQREERERDAEGRLQKALSAVHEQMEELKSDIASERSRLQRDNGRLQDLVSEMRLKSKAESDSFRAEIERIAEDTETSLKTARDDLHAVTRQRDALKQDLQASQTKVSQLERELADERRAYDSLSRRNAQATQSMASQAELARKGEVAASIQAELDQARAETGRLERLLSQRSHSLQEAEARLTQMRTERETVMRELEDFERDLQAQRMESKAFGTQLQALKHKQSITAENHRAELVDLERELRDARDKERRTASELAEVRSRYKQIETWRLEHQCDSGISEALTDQKARFKSQSRELATQIRYLKAKFTRESTFRNALSMQKRYLLLLVGGMSLDQQATLKAIAQMGYPAPEPVKKRKSLRSVGLAVLSIIRARNTAKQWRAEVDLKSQAVAAHSERRRVSART